MHERANRGLRQFLVRDVCKVKSIALLRGLTHNADSFSGSEAFHVSSADQSPKICWYICWYILFFMKLLRLFSISYAPYQAPVGIERYAEASRERFLTSEEFSRLGDASPQGGNCGARMER
jgi:hypothetical protein